MGYNLDMGDLFYEDSRCINQLQQLTTRANQAERESRRDGGGGNTRQAPLSLSGIRRDSMLPASATEAAHARTAAAGDRSQSRSPTVGNSPRASTLATAAQNFIYPVTNGNGLTAIDRRHGPVYFLLTCTQAPWSPSSRGTEPPSRQRDRTRHTWDPRKRNHHSEHGHDEYCKRAT